uniref:ShKT domain-containing protein n=1 Tax=Panagrellus redivivus TaxID=6233 RepID=A0A7E4VGJ1_PANRE
MRFISISMFIAVIGTAAAIESFTTDGDNNLVEMPFPRGKLNASDSGKTVPGPSSIRRDAEEANEIAIGEETGPQLPEINGPMLPEGGPVLPEITLPEIKVPEPTAPNMSAEMVEIDTEEAPAAPKQPSEAVENVTTADRPNPNKSGLLRCQDPVTKLFAPNARVCKDERGPKICETLFSPPDETTGRRDPRCDLPGMEDISNTCRKQCAICCEHIDYSCEDDDSGLIDCSKNLDKCTHSRWFDALSKYCAGSCGLCQRTSCRDAVSDCLPRKAICSDPNHKDLMRKQCARTCGFCQVGSIGTTEPADNNNNNNKVPPKTKQCVDLASNCAARSNLCENTLYAEYMARYCAKTCNKCDSQPGPAARPMACKDSNAECDKWVSDGLCTNKLYSVDYKRTHCAYSCKLC